MFYGPIVYWTLSFLWKIFSMRRIWEENLRGRIIIQQARAQQKEMEGPEVSQELCRDLRNYRLDFNTLAIQGGS